MSSGRSPLRVLDLLHKVLDLTGSVGPLTSRPNDVGVVPAKVRRGVALLHKDQLVGLVATDALAIWCTDGPRLLRLTGIALLEEWAAHNPVDGRCPLCDTDTSEDRPCPARRRMNSHLVSPDSVRGVS